MRVLVIEHHPLMARALKQGLEEEGFAVTLALTREEGDCHARDPHFDRKPHQAGDRNLIDQLRGEMQ